MRSAWVAASRWASNRRTSRNVRQHQAARLLPLPVPPHKTPPRQPLHASPALQPLPPLDAAAELLGVSTSTVRRRITDGQLRAFRTGKRLIRIRLQDLDDLLREIPSAGRGPRSVRGR